MMNQAFPTIEARHKLENFQKYQEIMCTYTEEKKVRSFIFLYAHNFILNQLDEAINK